MSNLEQIHKNMNTSDFYKFKEGSNKMRIMSDFVEVKTLNRESKYVGIVSEENPKQDGDTERTQGWAWAIIRGDAKKEEGDDYVIVKFGRKILGQLVAFKNNPEYAFDEFPMPYDIDVQTTNAGEMNVIYTVVASRKNTEVSEKEMEKLNKKKSIKDIVDNIISKQNEKGYGDYDKKSEDYPEASENNSANKF